jgi:hypothetical protein
VLFAVYRRRRCVWFRWRLSLSPSSSAPVRVKMRLPNCVRPDVWFYVPVRTSHCPAVDCKRGLRILCSWLFLCLVLSKIFQFSLTRTACLLFFPPNSSVKASSMQACVCGPWIVLLMSSTCLIHVLFAALQRGCWGSIVVTHLAHRYLFMGFLIQLEMMSSQFFDLCAELVHFTALKEFQF